MIFSPSSLISFLVALSFACGLNLYATLAVLGLLGRYGSVPLPGGLHVLASGWIISIAALLFAIEFFGDKIPGFDLLWNAAHTFIRIPTAALLAFHASQQLSPAMQMLVTLIAGAVAAIAHGSKTAARAAVTASPEPVSNIALSTAEDGLAIALTWVATHHPVVAGVAAGAAVLVCLLLVRWLAKAVEQQFARLRQKFGSGLFQG